MSKIMIRGIQTMLNSPMKKSSKKKKSSSSKSSRTKSMLTTEEDESFFNTESFHTAATAVTLDESSNHSYVDVEEYNDDDDGDCVVDDYDADTSSRTTSSRTIQFASTVKTQLIESHECYSDEEYANCWYTKEEKQLMRSEDIDVVVERMDSGKPAKRNMPYRGLEAWSEVGSEVFTSQVHLIVDTVMDEQDRQWSDNITDHDRIAELSQSVTAVSAERARLIAEIDQKEAMAIYNKNLSPKKTNNKKKVVTMTIPTPSRSFINRSRQGPPGAAVGERCNRSNKLRAL